MFLKKIRGNFKKIQFRLTLIFSLIFMISSGILFVFSFLFLYTSMENTEAEEARRRLLNYWALFQSGSIDLVIEEIDKEAFLYGDRPFFARIADQTNLTLYLRYPESWSEYSIESLESLSIIDFEQSLTLRSETSDNFLEVYSVSLSESYILQIGISTVRNVQLLKLYRRNFVFLLMGLILLGFSAGSFFSGRFLSPLRNLKIALKDILSTGDFSKRVPQKEINDDLEDIISMFNTMLMRIETLIIQMKGNLDTVAHDLRTPMTIFRGYAEHALENPNDKVAASEALSISLEQSERIISMLNTLMDISEAESGTLKLHKEDLNLGKVVESLVEMYNFIAQERDIKIGFHMVDCQLNADPVRIRQAVGNVIDNAVKFSYTNSFIDVRIEDVADFVSLIIKDTGPGIMEEDLPFIWDRLYRGSQAENVPGTGLGLSLVKAVVKAHLGTVDAVSTPGEGSIFVIRLPKS